MLLLNILKDLPKSLQKKYSVTVCSSDLTGIKDFAESEDVNYFSVPMKRKSVPSTIYIQSFV